jgi:hypothetical protein
MKWQNKSEAKALKPFIDKGLSMAQTIDFKITGSMVEYLALPGLNGFNDNDLTVDRRGIRTPVRG